MPVVHKLPSDLVIAMTEPGLDTTAGPVPLDQYMCKNVDNGGNDNTKALIGQLRWMKDNNGKGKMLNDLVGNDPIDILLKGQGEPKHFVQVWEFMLRNKEQLKKINVETSHYEKGGKIPDGKNGNVFDLYFKNNTDANALHAMVRDRFFGIDCVGFVANYLIYIGIWDKYKGYDINLWPDIFTTRINGIDDIRMLNIVIWPPKTHIAIIDRVVEKVGETVRVELCQSNGGGPKTNAFVHLKQTGFIDGRMRFDIADGVPPMNPAGSVIVCGMPDLSYSGPLMDIGPVTAS